MRESIQQWAETLPEPLAVFLIAMLPVFELRGAIPYAYSAAANYYGTLHPWWTYLIAVAGNFTPVCRSCCCWGPRNAICAASAGSTASWIGSSDARKAQRSDPPLSGSGADSLRGGFPPR